jgi:hypothetical protein
MDTNVSVKVITPEIAAKWIASYLYDHQRPVRQHRVAFLAEEMRRNQFKQDTPIEISRVGGRKFLTDGQHRLAAIVVSHKPQRFVVVERALDNEDAVAADYTRTDKNMVRTVADDYRVLLLENELGLTATQVNKLGAAVNVIYGNFLPRAGTQKMHLDDKLRLMREYNDAYGDFLEAISGCPGDMWKRMNRRATLGVALVTFRHSVLAYGSKVEEFWKGTAFDDGLRAGDARKVALRHILSTGMEGGAQGGSKNVATWEYSSRVIANCFNAYVTEQPRLLTRVRDTSKPITILGSPFNGK